MLLRVPAVNGNIYSSQKKSTLSSAECGIETAQPNKTWKMGWLLGTHQCCTKAYSAQKVKNKNRFAGRTD